MAQAIWSSLFSFIICPTFWNIMKSAMNGKLWRIMWQSCARAPWKEIPHYIVFLLNLLTLCPPCKVLGLNLFMFIFSPETSTWGKSPSYIPTFLFLVLVKPHIIFLMSPVPPLGVSAHQYPTVVNKTKQAWVPFSLEEHEEGYYKNV